jgi:glycosyltransferase involved in cell wall biosynthesis
MPSVPQPRKSATGPFESPRASDNRRRERGRSIAYVTSRFPLLSETFILLELQELRRRGWTIELLPLIRQKTDVRHAEVAYWDRVARYTPFLSIEILRANLAALWKRPRTYLGLWRDIVLGTWRCPNFLIGAFGIFPKSVYLAEVVRRAGIRHVHAHYMTHPAVAALIIAELADASFSVTAHAHDLYVHQDMLATKVERARFIATISRFNRRFIAQHAGSGALEKTKVVHCGVDLSRFTPTEPPPSRPFRIVSVASLQPYKGIVHLIRAAAILRSRGLEFECRVVGEGELRPELEHEIRALGLDDRLHLVGPLPRDAVADELRRAHVFALPSVIERSGKMEGIPVSAMEAMASGRPVVATRISGVSELVRHEETGLLVEPSDPEALADALERLAGDSELAQKLAQSARRLVVREFDLRANVVQLERYFAEILDADGLEATA